MTVDVLELLYACNSVSGQGRGEVATRTLAEAPVAQLPMPGLAHAMPMEEALAPTPTACTLIQGDFDKFVQFLLALLSISVLVIKRWKEHPRRPLNVWLLDTSKQCFGAGVAHLTNLLISIYMAERGGADECAIYFVNFILDTTVGVFVSYLLLKASQKGARACGFGDLVRSGYYGEVVSLRAWGVQVVLWLLITFMSKLVISGIILALWTPLTDMADSLFAVFEGHRKTELVLVMIVAPTILNAFQFWIQDNFLKADEKDPASERLPLMKVEDKAAQKLGGAAVVQRRRPSTPENGVRGRGGVEEAAVPASTSVALALGPVNNVNGAISIPSFSTGVMSNGTTGAKGGSGKAIQEEHVD